MNIQKIYFIIYCTVVLQLLASCCECNDNMEDIRPASERVIYAKPGLTATPNEGMQLDINKDQINDYQIGFNAIKQSFVITCLRSDALNTAGYLLYNNPLKYADAGLKTFGYNEPLSGYYVFDFATIEALDWKGKGPRYLGFRLKIDQKFYNGWLRCELNETGDRFIVQEYALDMRDRTLWAGQRE